MRIATLGRESGIPGLDRIAFRSAAAALADVDALVVCPGACLAEYADGFERGARDGVPPQLGLRASESFATDLRRWQDALDAWLREGGLAVVVCRDPVRVRIHTVETTIDLALAAALPAGPLVRFANAGPAADAPLAIEGGEPFRSFLEGCADLLQPHPGLEALAGERLAHAGAPAALHTRHVAGHVLHLVLDERRWRAAHTAGLDRLARRLVQARKGTLPRWVARHTTAEDAALVRERASLDAEAAALAARREALERRTAAARHAWRLAWVSDRELWDATADMFRAHGASIIQGETPDEDMVVLLADRTAVLFFHDGARPIERDAARLAEFARAERARPPQQEVVPVLVVADEQAVAPAGRRDPRTVAADGVTVVTPLQLLALARAGTLRDWLRGETEPPRDAAALFIGIDRA